MKAQLFTLTSTSPASATTAVGASTATQANLQEFDWFDVTAELQGATGGTLDVYLQRKEAADTWKDWVHFPQLAAAAAAVKYHVPGNGSIAAITVIGGGTDATPGVVLAANTACGGLPGSALRVVFVAGAGTSAGAAQTVRISAHRMGT